MAEKDHRGTKRRGGGAAAEAPRVLGPAPPLPQQPPGFVQPKTPWGDPDIQGNYTNLSEAGTAMERPKEFDGRNLDDIDPQERARLKKESAERTIGRFLGPAEAPDNWWQPAYGKYAENGAQLWLIVDPADGKIPPLTTAAQARQAARADARRRSACG